MFSNLNSTEALKVAENHLTKSERARKIELKRITVRDLTQGFLNDEESGRIAGYGGNLDIRPPYQREFIYKERQSEAVIDTVFKGFPLNVMYWATRADGTFEIIDGQQRTISLCQFVFGEFAFDFRYFRNLQADGQERILLYELMIYVCSGTDSEKLSWFRTQCDTSVRTDALRRKSVRNF